MADGVFNIAKGRAAEKVADLSAKIGVLLLKVAEADATLADYDTLATLLAAAGNTEANFTTYERKEALTATGPTITDASEQVTIDLADQTWTAAGGTTDNTLVKLIVYQEESAADSGRIPLTHHDFAVTTDGNDLIAQFHADGFYKAT